MADEDRDPTSCSLIFFALGKKKVVHGLWRQAPGHKEQNLMLKFLANDFEEGRWKTAAAKNAYALLSKQRYGESFFLPLARSSVDHSQSTQRPFSCFPAARKTLSMCVYANLTIGSWLSPLLERSRMGWKDRSSSPF